MASNWKELVDDSDSESDFFGFEDDDLVRNSSSVSLDLDVSDVSDVNSTGSEAESDDDGVFDFFFNVNKGIYKNESMIFKILGKCYYYLFLSVYYNIEYINT